MLDYRLYCLGGDGRFIKAHELFAEDDNEAIAKAESLELKSRCELWERDRLVAEISAHWG